MKFKKYIKESKLEESKLSLELTEEYNRSTLIESLQDMDKRCEKCNTLLNDGGTCPKCDDGEEDYEDNDIMEALSNREKLKRAYPELNFDTPMTEDTTTETQVVKEGLSVREKLKAAYPELNFDKPVTEGISEKDHTTDDTNESLSNKEKLARAYPELDFAADDATITEGTDIDEFDEYDDDYDIYDDVEEDRVHAALYGGDKTYCSCGRKLVRTEWGGYCPDCDNEDEYK